MLRSRLLAVGRVSAVLIVIGLLVVGFSGCSNNPYTPGATSGSVLYGALSEDPKSMDPSVAYIVTDSLVVSLIYPSYFRYSYLKRDPIGMDLNLGAEQPKREPTTYTVSEKGHAVTRNGESWTFRIKKGLRFQDDPCFAGGKGREITAADFIYAFQRMADPAVPCPVLSYFEDKVIGLHEFAEYNRGRAAKGLSTDYKYHVDGLQIDPHDPYTFRVILNRPYPQLRYMMAMQFTTPIPHEATERYGIKFARHPVGSGPYMLDEYSPRLKVVLKRNPNCKFESYPSVGAPGDRKAGLLKDAGEQLPIADKLVYRIFKEPLTAWNLFLQGYLDWGSMHDFGSTLVSQVMTHQGTLSKDMREKGVELTRAPTADMWYFAFNMRDPVFGGYTPEKRKLRQAISMAFDTQSLIDLGLQGNGTHAQFLIPPCVYGYDAGYRNPYCQLNIAKAKKLLAEAGYPNGINSKTGERLTIYFDNYLETAGAGGRAEVTMFAKMLDKIGVHLESRAYRYPVWYDKIQRRDFQFSLQGWVADYPDPENFAMLLYGPNEKNKGPNDSCYDNPVYNSLFEKMQAMEDGPDRQKVIRQMRDIAVEDCPWIYLYVDDTVMLSNKWLTNVKPHPVANDFPKYFRVDGPLRARMQAEWNRPNYIPAIVLALLFVVSTLPAAAVVRKRRNRRVRVRSGGTN